MPTCLEQGLVQCPNGSCADSLETCPTVYEDLELDIGYTPEGDFITDDPTTEWDEALENIYEAIGGSDYTKMGFAEWAAKYSEDFPTWEGSMYQKRSELKEGQLAILGEEIKLSEEGFGLRSEKSRFETASELEGIASQAESLIRKGGGLRSGQREKKIESAYDKVLQGFDFEQDALEIDKQSSLLDFTNKQLTYQLDLAGIEQEFTDRMWDMISANRELYKGDDSDGYSPTDSCMTQECIACTDKCDPQDTNCFRECQNERDDERDEYDGRDDEDRDRDDDRDDGRDERDYEDYWEHESEYS
jgi:hypothetical protein